MARSTHFSSISGHNGNGVAYMTYMTVKDKPVIGAGLRISLSGKGKSSAVLGNVFPSEYGFDALDFFSHAAVYFFYYRICMNRAEQLYNKAVSGSYILCVYGAFRLKAASRLFFVWVGLRISFAILPFQKFLYSSKLSLISGSIGRGCRQGIPLFRLPREKDFSLKRAMVFIIKPGLRIRTARHPGPL